MNSARLQHQSVQIAMVHRGGQDDLGAGGAQLLELQNQVLQLRHAAAADLDQKGVCTGNVVALQHLAAVLQQRQKSILLGGGNRKADERIHIHPVCRTVQCDGIAADDAVRFQLMDTAGDCRTGKRHLLRNFFDGHPCIFGQKGENFAVKIVHEKSLLQKYVGLYKIF